MAGPEPSYAERGYVPTEGRAFGLRTLECPLCPFWCFRRATIETHFDWHEVESRRQRAVAELLGGGIGGGRRRAP